MSTDTVAPAQLVLRGQVAAPDGPVDAAGMYVMHHAFRRDLRAFVAAASGTPVEDRATWRALAGRWDMFSRFLHHHHAGEDAGLWPMLMERVDATGRATLDAMEAEHAEIDPLLASCAGGFARLAAHADEDARRALEVHLVAGRERLEQHLAHEERDAMALVQAHLTPADWHRAEEKHFKAAYGPRETLQALPWALHALPPQAHRWISSAPGGRVFLGLWRLFLRRPFERRERAAFRYAARVA